MKGDDRTIIVFDFETNGLDIPTLFPIQVAAMAFNPRTLEPIKVNGTFESLMRPADMSQLDNTEQKRKALSINKKTREQIEAAPDEAVVWKQFCEWCYQFNPRGKSFFTAPIAAGQNIDRFDLPIAQRLCTQYGFTDKEGKMDIFSSYTSIDLKNILYLHFQGSEEIDNLKMDTIRPYFGLSDDNSHDALQDVKDTSALLMRFLKWHRQLTQTAVKNNWLRNSMRPQSV
jgi:DNA polymerase III epsilon subunit-like protein